MKVVRNFFMELSVVLGANITQAALYGVGGKVIFSMKYLLQNHFYFLMLAIASLLLSACGSGGCNAFQVLPAQISVTDVKGQWVTGYTVLYKVTGGTDTEKICEAASECLLDGLFGYYSSVTVSKKGFESVTVNPLDFTTINKPNGCTSQSAVAVALKSLS